MRWDNLAESPPTTGPTGDMALFGTDAVTTRTFDTSKLTSETHHTRYAQRYDKTSAGEPVRPTISRSRRREHIP